MRRVVLRRIKVQTFGWPDEELDYGRAYLDAVTRSNLQGYTVKEMAPLLPVKRKLERAIEVGIEVEGGEVLLEDEEHRVLVRAVEQVRWKRVSAAVVEMVEELKGAAVVEVEVKGGDHG